MVKGVYIVFCGSKQTGATYRKRDAIRCAKQHPDSEVRGMTRAAYRDSGPYGWDGPTFRIMSDLIYSDLIYKAQA